MQYTEEHYAQMYNGLPEGLKDLVLSGRLAILVSAIGSRHGLSADQIADLEPAIEDVCLGLITKAELVDNIRKSTNVDMRVATRISAEADLEILKPYDAELMIARKQKEELDEKIGSGAFDSVSQNKSASSTKFKEEPKNVSEHAQVKKISDWYSKDEQSFKNEDAGKNVATVTNFDWESDFGKKAVTPKHENEINTSTDHSPADKNLEGKLDQLTESINKLVNTRFGGAVAEPEISTQMQDLLKRLERAEKENEENKKLIQSLKGVKPVESIFGNATLTDMAPAQSNLNNIPIDKERKVEINHKDLAPKKEAETGNIQITSVSTQIPIEKQYFQTAPKTDTANVISSSVSMDTLDSIVATRNKTTPVPTDSTSTKTVLSMDELLANSDKKIKNVSSPMSSKTATLIFPSLNDEIKLDVKNLSQKDSIKQTLLDDLAFLQKEDKKKDDIMEDIPKVEEKVAEDQQATTTNTGPAVGQMNSSATYATNPFKEELIPKTKEERMRVLQDKIKSLNKGVSVGGKTNISTSNLDPYRL